MDSQNIPLAPTGETMPSSGPDASSTETTTPITSGVIQPNAPAPTKKSKKTLIVALAIILVLLCATAAFYFLYYTPRHNNRNETITAESTPASERPTEENTPVEPVADLPETEITDESIKTLLFDRMFILHHSGTLSDVYISWGGSYSQNEYFDFRSGYQVNENLYPDATVTNSDKLYIVTKYLEAKDQLEPVENFDVPADYYAQKFPEACSQWPCFDGLLSESKVEQTFAEFFGERPIHESPTHMCGQLTYDEEYHVYAVIPYGCGGIDPINHQLYVEKYTEKGNNAYVYIWTNSIEENNDPQIIYKSFLRLSNFYDSEAREKLALDESLIYSTIPGGSEYGMQITGDNYQDFEAYRFVFQKTGTNYVFKRVEKL